MPNPPSLAQSLDHDPVAQRILTSARQQFMTLGFKNVTMDDLASDMGMSKKTLYAHFPSKSALVKGVLTQKLDEAERAVPAPSLDQVAVPTGQAKPLPCSCQSRARRSEGKFARPTAPTIRAGAVAAIRDRRIAPFGQL